MHGYARGYTLVELLVTMVVVAILVGVAFPSAREMYTRGLVSSTVNDMVMAVNIARSEGARRGGQVEMRATTPDDDANEWGPGWTVVDARDDTVLQTFGAAGGNLTLDGTDEVTAIAFDARGMPTPAMSVDVCSPDGGVRIAITPVGRTTREEVTAEDCL